MPATEPAPRSGRRQRGDRAGLSPARIVEAARGLDADTITVQAVADRLGVNRATVHHHINDLDTLREMIALDAFAMRFAPVIVPPDADWREACSILAHSMHNAVVAAGGLGTYVRLRAADVAQLEPVERTLRIMIAAGFDDETAARCLAALANLAAAVAREGIIAERERGHPQISELQHALQNDHGAGFTVLRRLAEADLVRYNDTQLNLSINIFLDGMATRLSRQSPM
jgi:TetR/AcrR family transcriptional regulator, tetracycline repressor protein